MLPRPRASLVKWKAPRQSLKCGSRRWINTQSSSVDTTSSPETVRGPMSASRSAGSSRPNPRPAFDNERSLPNTFLVRCETGIENMAEAFAVLRAVEQVYGPIQFYRTLWDYEDRRIYQRQLWVMLKKSASFEMVRRMVGEVIQVQAPVVELNRQGGIGWDDLQAGLMFPSFNDVVQQTGDKSAPNWEGALDDSETHARMLRIIVTRSMSNKTFFDNPALTVDSKDRRLQRLSTGHAFMDWGGFAPLEPLNGRDLAKYRRITDGRVLDGDVCASNLTHGMRDRPNMRVALTKWSLVTRRPDPNVSPRIVAESPIKGTTIKKRFEGKTTKVEAPQPEKQPQNQSEHQPRNKPEKPPESPVEQPAEKLVSPPNVASNRTSTIKKAETSTPVSAGGTQLLSRKEMRLMVQTAVRERKGGKRGQANAVKDPKEADKDEGTGLAARLRKLVGGWL